MSFNPVMALLVQGVMSHLAPSAARIVELGNQTFSVDDGTLGRIRERLRSAPGNVGPGADAVMLSLERLTGKERSAATHDYYRALGAKSYTAIDVNDTYGSLVMDLNRDLAAEYGFTDAFDIVTNNGTGEHVFDQGAIFRNAHALAKVGGLMIHVLPFVEYVNHGFYSFHPNFFHALAYANRYDLLALGVATREGFGAITTNKDADALQGALRNGLSVSLDVLLSEPRIPRRNFPRRWVELALASMPNADEELRFGKLLYQLMLKRRKILVFAVLRRTQVDAFKVPIQLRYADVVQAEKLQSASHSAGRLRSEVNA